MKIARYFDAAILKPDMTPEQVEAAIQESIGYGSRTVCVRGCDIDLAKRLTAGTDTGVSCVLDFPYGYGGVDAKRAAAKAYAAKGVMDIDMVMNYGAARGGAWDVVEEEIRAVVEEAHKCGVEVKVIFETSQLTIDQIRKATEVCIAAGADFVKTSTGFNGSGATVEAVQAMLDTARGRIKVKPSGGIRNYETAKMYVDMGVHRLGIGYTSCKLIVEGEEAAK
ncbi:MAG: deoxyribose-phosphate aldolase [Candidatus Hydrogenedens sp.]|nr:deoxyribose-phosphate aldolase [Candidatus Hydrogenedens sp.]